MAYADARSGVGIRFLRFLLRALITAGLVGLAWFLGASVASAAQRPITPLDQPAAVMPAPSPAPSHRAVDPSVASDGGAHPITTAVDSLAARRMTGRPVAAAVSVSWPVSWAENWATAVTVRVPAAVESSHLVRPVSQLVTTAATAELTTVTSVLPHADPKVVDGNPKTDPRRAEPLTGEVTGGNRKTGTHHGAAVLAPSAAWSARAVGVPLDPDPGPRPAPDSSPPAASLSVEHAGSDGEGHGVIGHQASGGAAPRSPAGDAVAGDLAAVTGEAAGLPSTSPD